MPAKVANTSIPTLGQLSAELGNFENWYLLGLQLNISKDTLDSIVKSHDSTVQRCVEMIQHWISNSKNPSWGAIHEGLRNISESTLAAKIAEKYDILLCSSSEVNSKSIASSGSSKEKSPVLMSRVNSVGSSRGKTVTSEHYSIVQSGTSDKKSLTLAVQLIKQEGWRICAYFATVMMRIRNILEKQVKPDELVCFLRFYCHPLNAESLYVDKQILHVSSVSEMMESLVPDYINYMNTGLLEVIIESFECKEAQHLLQQYHNRYPQLRQLKDMPDPASDERLDLTRRKRLIVKCDGDFDSARATDVQGVQRSIESATGIDRQFVTPAQHNEGSFILTFLIPDSVGGLFQELCDEDLEILAKAGIMELRIDDFVINDIEKFHPQRTRISTQSIRVISANQTGVTTKGFDSHMQQRVEQFTGKEKDQLKCLLESIPRSKLEEVCSDSFLQQLATRMRDWRKLAPHFGISESTAEELAHRFQDVDEQKYRALHCWKQISPDTATYQNLIACLLAHAPFDLAEATVKMLTPGMHINGITVKL